MDSNFNTFIEKNTGESIFVHFSFEDDYWKEIAEDHLVTRNGTTIPFTYIEDELKEIINNKFFELFQIISQEYSFELSIAEIKIRKKCLEVILSLIGTFLVTSSYTENKNITEKEREEKLRHNTLMAIGIIAVTIIFGTYCYFQYKTNNIINEQKIENNNQQIEINQLKKFISKHFPDKDNAQLIETIQQIKYSPISIPDVIEEIEDKNNFNFSPK